MDALRRGCTELATTFCQTFNATSPIQDVWTFIKTHLLKLQDQHVPSKQSSTRYSQSWINREVKSLSMKKKRSYDKARRTGIAKDFRRYKHLKQLSTEACRRAYNNYITNIISPDSTENPKRFWGFIKGLPTENTGIAPLKDSTGMTQSDGSKKADILNCQFSSSNVTQFQTRVPVHLMICQPSKLDWKESIRYSTDFKFTRPQGQTKYLVVF